MRSVKLHLKKHLWPAKSKALVIVIAAISVLAVGGILGARQWYYQNLKPVSASQRQTIVTIPVGSTLQEIAAQLKEQELIRNTWAFTRYVRNLGAEEHLKAGTYSLRPNQTVKEIVTILTQGKILTNLVTILPGQRIDQIHQALTEAGFSQTAVDQALDPAQYPNHPALVDKPVGANLEGYLYPESFQKTVDTKASAIVKQSLDEMQKRLTPELRSGIVKQGLTVHQGLILASVIEQEVSKPEDRAIVAQVFLKRLRVGMPLESDPTAPYGAILDGQTPTLDYNSAYNTYLNVGLPPGPISNVTESSLKALANPAATDWLYFVSGDDGVTYFSKTLAEHENLTRQHCTRRCNNTD